MKILQEIQSAITQGLASIYDHSANEADILVSQTRKEFEGDYTVVVFPFVKALKSNPVELGNKLGEYVVDNHVDVVAFNVVKGFFKL